MLAEARHKQIDFGHLWPRLSMCACAVSDYRQLGDLGVWIFGSSTSLLVCRCAALIFES